MYGCVLSIYLSPPGYKPVIYIEGLCNMDALSLSFFLLLLFFFTQAQTGTVQPRRCVCPLPRFSRPTRNIFGQSPEAAGLMELFTWSAEGGLTTARRRSLDVDQRRDRTAREGRGCSRRGGGGGAEPARRIITSLTSLGLVVGMNNIQ